MSWRLKPVTADGRTSSALAIIGLTPKPIPPARSWPAERVTAAGQQNHRPHHETTDNQQPCSALPLPARQPAFFAYFLFGEKKVGRSGGAKAFDFKLLTLSF